MRVTVLQMCIDVTIVAHVVLAQAISSGCDPIERQQLRVRRNEQIFAAFEKVVSPNGMKWNPEALGNQKDDQAEPAVQYVEDSRKNETKLEIMKL